VLVNVMIVDVRKMVNSEIRGYKVGQVIGILIQAYLLYLFLHWVF
jgi:hypothetical protein